MSLLPHIEDAFRAAAHKAERDWPGDDTDYAPGDEEPMTVQPVDCGGCGRCLRCALVASREKGRWWR